MTPSSWSETFATEGLNGGDNEYRSSSAGSLDRLLHLRFLPPDQGRRARGRTERLLSPTGSGLTRPVAFAAPPSRRQLGAQSGYQSLAAVVQFDEG